MHLKCVLLHITCLLIMLMCANVWHTSIQISSSHVSHTEDVQSIYKAKLYKLLIERRVSGSYHVIACIFDC